MLLLPDWPNVHCITTPNLAFALFATLLTIVRAVVSKVSKCNAEIMHKVLVVIVLIGTLDNMSNHVKVRKLAVLVVACKGDYKWLSPQRICFPSCLAPWSFFKKIL